MRYCATQHIYLRFDNLVQVQFNKNVSQQEQEIIHHFKQPVMNSQSYNIYVQYMFQDILKQEIRNTFRIFR